MNHRIILSIFIFLQILIIKPSFAEESRQIVNLKQGYNFISFTITPNLSPIELQKKYQAIEDIFFYNASAGSFVSLSDGALSLFKVGKGYIIKSSELTELEIIGTEVNVVGNIILKKGFNLIGFSKMPESIKFKSLMERANLLCGIYKWNANSGCFIQVIRNQSNNLPELLDGVDPDLAAGQAYFLNMLNETTLNYDSAEINIENGVSLPVLTSISINPNKETIVAGSTYDLSKLIITATYSNNFNSTTNNVKWTIKSGSGTLNGSLFTAKNTPDTVILNASYNENGITKDCDVTVTVILVQETIESKSTIISTSEIELKLGSGAIFKMSPSASDVNETVMFSKIIQKGFSMTNQSVFKVSSTKKIDICELKIPVPLNTSNNDVFVGYFPSDSSDDAVKLEGKTDVNSTYYVVSIGSVPTKRVKNYMKSNAGDHIPDTIEERDVYVEVKPKEEELIPIVEKLKIKPQFYIEWPYYTQYNNTCWAATLLILLRGYLSDSSYGFDKFNTIYKMLSVTNIAKNSSNTSFWGGNSLQNLIGTYLNDKDVDYPRFIYHESLKKYVLEKILTGIPVIIGGPTHLTLCLGYEIDQTALKNSNGTEIFKDVTDTEGKDISPVKFVVHDPADRGPYSYSRISDSIYSINRSYLHIHYAYCSSKTSTSVRDVRTIHMPDYEIDSQSHMPARGVMFCKGNMDTENYNVIDACSWDHSTVEGYKFKNYQEIPSFGWVNLFNIPIYDTRFKNCKTDLSEVDVNVNMLTVKRNESKYLNTTKESLTRKHDSLPIARAYQFNKKIYVNDLFKDVTAYDGNEFILRVSINEGINYLEGFDILFKYRKLFITPDSSVNINEIKSPSTINFAAKLVDNTVIQSEQLYWSAEPVDGKVTVSNGKVNILIGASGKYIIKAVVKDTVAIHGGKEATYEITVGSSTGLLQINPSKFKIGIFEDTALEAKVDGVAVSAQWSILDASGGVVDDSVDKTSGTISAGSSGVSSPSKSNSPGITALRCIYKAPEGHGEYIIRAAYGGKTAAVKITVMPLTMVLTIPSYMDINAVQEFFVTIKGITEPKTISALPDGGKITDVKQEFKAGTIPEDNEMIFTKNFSLGANDSSDKYTITAKLLGIPIDKSIQRSINIVKSITATPKGASIASGGKLPLEASINGGGIVKAVWTLEGANSGSIIDNEDGTKVYVAPAVPGTYKITAQYLDYTDEMYVTVTNTPSSLAITFSPLDPVIYPDEVIKIKAIVNEPKLYNGFNITNAGGELAGPVSYGVTPDAKSYFFEYSFSVPAGDNKETISIVAMIMESGEVLAKSTNTIKVVRSINVTPKNSTIATGEQLTLSATIIGGEKVKAEWSIDTAEGGSIVNNEDGTAVYTAPSAYGTYKITARYLEYFAETYVTVYSSVPTIKIVCSYPSVGAGMSIYGIYADLGNRNDEIIWSCESGSVSSNGRFCEYLAPATPGRYKLTATVKGTEVKDEIEIEVTAVSFIISPSTSIVKYGEKVQLEGVVTGTEAGTFEMSWQLEEPSAGGAIEVIGGQYSPDNKSGAPARMIMYNRRCIYTAPPETGLGIRYVKATCTQPFGKTWTARAKIKVIGEDNPAAQLAINNVVSGKAIVNIDDNIDLRPNIIGANAGQQVIMVDNKDLQMTQDDAGSGIISDTWSYIPPMTPLINGTGGIFEVFFEMFNPYRHVLVKIEVPDVKIKMTPETIKLGVGESYTFRSDVSGLTSKPALTWTSDGVLMNVDNNSRIYTAPNVTGSGNIKSEFTYTVRNLQITRNASAAITIDDIFLSSPIDGVTVENGSTTQFNVSVAGAYNKAIDSIAVEGQTDGAIIENAPAGSGFMYTFKAPTYTGQFTSDAELYIKAVSSANKSKFGLFKVKVKRPR